MPKLKQSLEIDMAAQRSVIYSRKQSPNTENDHSVRGRAPLYESPGGKIETIETAGDFSSSKKDTLN